MVACCGERATERGTAAAPRALPEVGDKTRCLDAAGDDSLGGRGWSPFEDRYRRVGQGVAALTTVEALVSDPLRCLRAFRLRVQQVFEA